MISAILLAAGQSRRMGEPKALLDWGGQPLIAYQIEQLARAGCDDVVVVLGSRADTIHRAIRRLSCRVVHNAISIQGRAGSLRIGAKAVNRDTAAIVIVSVDQPRPADITKALIDAHSDPAGLTVPTCGGHSGHPVIVPGTLRTQLMDAREADGGLRGVLERAGLKRNSVELDERCHIDINTPEEYQAALSKFGIGDGR